MRKRQTEWVNPAPVHTHLVPGGDLVLPSTSSVLHHVSPEDAMDESRWAQGLPHVCRQTVLFVGSVDPQEPPSPFGYVPENASCKHWES